MWALGMPGPILQVARTYNDHVATFRQHLSSEAKRREHSDITPGLYSQFYWQYVLKYFCVILGVALFILVLLLFQNDLKELAVTETIVLQHAADAMGARCLDGSPVAYHISRGHNSKKWMIYHEGGDWCSQMMRVDSSLERENWSCLTRASTHLGSSKFSTRFSFKDYGRRFGYFSRNYKKNPMMHDWNLVMLPYCDGGSFSGNRRFPALIEGQDLFLRGRQITEAVMADLVPKGLDRATDVVVAGASAGGLAVFLQVDDWRAAILKAAVNAMRTDIPRVSGLSDGGFFPSIQVKEKPCNYYVRMMSTFQNHNITSSSVERCLRNHPGKHGGANRKPWMCMFAQWLAPFVESPVFTTLSAYDSWQLEFELCPSSIGGIEEFANTVRTEAIKALLHNPLSGAFIDSCRHHTKCWSDIVVDAYTPAQAHAVWYHKYVVKADGEAKRLWMQKDSYENGKCPAFASSTECRIGLPYAEGDFPKEDNIVAKALSKQLKSVTWVDLDDKVDQEDRDGIREYSHASLKWG